MEIEMVRDSYNNGHIHGVARIGRVFILCCTFTQQADASELKSLASVVDWADGRTCADIGALIDGMTFERNPAR